MTEQEAKNFETNICNTLAHQVAIAAALSLAATSRPDGREILERYERDLLSSSIWQFGNSGAPASYGEKYRAELSNIFSRAKANAGFTK